MRDARPPRCQFHLLLASHQGYFDLKIVGSSGVMVKFLIKLSVTKEFFRHNDIVGSVHYHYCRTIVRGLDGYVRVCGELL